MAMKEVGRVLEIFMYPLKSCRGISLQGAECTHSGLFSGDNTEIGDRRFMLVKGNGTFVTQRSDPTMALISTAIKDGMLSVTAPGMQELLVPIPDPDTVDTREFHHVKVWQERVGGLNCGEEAAAWFSKYLKKPITLLFAGSDNRRDRQEYCGHADDKIAYQDELPYLLIAEASMKELNSRLEEGVQHINFRPNIYIQTTEPFVEDNWKEIMIGTAKFKNIKPCYRCTVPTVNPEIGVKNKEGQPIKTLKEYRIKPEVDVKEPCFGTLLSAIETGHISVGDTVYAV